MSERKSRLKLFVVEVTGKDSCSEYEVIAESGGHAADLLKAHLAPVTIGMHFRARSTPNSVEGEARVLRKLL